MKRALIGLLVGALALAGCGGSSSRNRAVITGNVADVNNNPVVGATVRVGNQTTQTTQQGAYRLENVSTGTQTVTAEIMIGNTRYTGRNVANLVSDQFGNQSKSVNITVSPQSSQGTLEGFVNDPSNRPIQGARVFASSATELSAAVAITNSDGYYRIERLLAGNYLVTASAQGYTNDVRTERPVVAGQARTTSFVLQFSGVQNLPAPTNPQATAYTLPREVTRSVADAQTARAYEAIKNAIDPQRKAGKAGVTRQTSPTSFVQTELSWDYNSQNLTNLLGFGIFRGPGTNRIEAIDILRDPLALFYADQDDNLTPGVRYYYQIAAVGTTYPDDRNAISPLTAVVSAMPLNPFGNANVNTGPLRFSWQPVPGATAYDVLVYSGFPDLNLPPLQRAELGNVTTYTYAGPALVSGRNYYWVVVAYGDERNGRFNARSFSRVLRFTAP